MIGKVVLSSLFLIALSLVQTTWIQPIAIAGIIPDLALLAVVAVAYRNGPILGTTSSFIAGLVEDILSAAPLGFNAFVSSLAAWLASFLHGSIQLDRILMPALLGIGATVYKAFAVLLLDSMFRSKLPSYDLGGSQFWIELGYNALAAPIVFAVSSLLYRLTYARKGRAE
ncbi:MAG: rod shape-determining protein MreD [Spirochaetota bacterium]